MFTKKSSRFSKNISSSPAVALSGPAIISTHSVEGDKGTNMFADKHYITCIMGNRSFFFAITQNGSMNRVYRVQIDIKETLEGKDSARLKVVAALHQANGASCVTDSEFSDAVEVKKKKLSDRELVRYKFIDEPDSLSGFSLEKQTNSEFVEKITVTHCFSIGEDAFYHVAIKMGVSKRSAGLLVDVNGPVKHTRNFMDQRLFKFIDEPSREQCKNGPFNGSTSKDTRLVQPLDSYVNTGTQNLTGLINSEGSSEGNGNNSVFLKCTIYQQFCYPNT